LEYPVNWWRWVETSINFSFFCGMSETTIGAAVGAATEGLAFVNMVPNPILERFSCDSSVRRYAGPSDIFLE
jgi:hypothetical protein